MAFEMRYLTGKMNTAPTDFRVRETLEDRVRRTGALPAREVVRLGIALLSSLAMTHERALAHGASPNVASDVYACGAMLYLAATGFPPYTAPSAALGEAVREGMLRTPAKFRPELPPSLVRVLVDAMKADPAQRYASARAMLEALEHAQRT